jgi:hypothetical protein
VTAEHCKVVILHEGERYNLPVGPEDECFFDGKFEAVNPEGVRESFTPEIDQVKMWVEDPKTGEEVR